MMIARREAKESSEMEEEDWRWEHEAGDGGSTGGWIGQTGDARDPQFTWDVDPLTGRNFFYNERGNRVFVLGSNAPPPQPTGTAGAPAAPAAPAAVAAQAEAVETGSADGFASPAVSTPAAAAPGGGGAAESLLPGTLWSPVWDQSAQSYYYIHNESGEAVWDAPEELDEASVARSGMSG